MTKIDDKAKVLEIAKARFADCENKVKAMEKSIDDARRPFDEKVWKLEQERDAITGPMYETCRGHSALRDTARKVLDEAQKAYDAAVAEGVIPVDWLTFNQWWAKVGMHYIGTRCGWRNQWKQAVTPPKIAGCTVWAAKDDSYNEKVYCVWEEATGRLVGVMVVEPAQHIGDYTSAKVVIEGTEYGEGFGSEVDKPLKRFVEAVKWAVTKKAPLWRTVSKDERLPVGAIVKIQTYGGYSGHEKFDFGVVVGANDNGVNVGHKADLYTEMVDKYDPDNKGGATVDRSMMVQVNDNGIVTIDKVRGVA